MANYSSIPSGIDLAGQDELFAADMKRLGLLLDEADKEYRGRLLIVDDGAAQARVLQAILEDQGYEAVVAANANDGLARCNDGSFDLVLSDIARPMEPSYLVELIHAIIEKKRSERRQSAQYEVSRVLSEAGSFGDASPKLFEVISKVGNWQAGAFWRVNFKAHVLQCEGFWADSAWFSELAGVCKKCTCPLGVDLPGRAWNDGKPVWIADLAQEIETRKQGDKNSVGISSPCLPVSLSPCLEPPRNPAAVRAGLHNVLALPIMLGDEVLGVFEFFGRDVGGPDEQTLQVLAGIANQIGQYMERKRLEDYFRQSQKMEAVGKLAGGIAHDFNNLLTVINGYSEYVMARLQPGDPLRDPVEQINRAGERATTLTRQLLAFSRKQVLLPQSLDLGKHMTEMQKLLDRLIGEDIDLQLSLQSDLWRVKADPCQIEQVIMNLIVNARDAMPKGGKVTIEARNVEFGPAYIKAHPYTRPGEYVMLAVCDTGCGIDDATRANLFEPFFTTKGDKGTGLGLATVYGIVKQSGGYIEVYSEIGVGTTFKVYLPRDAEAELEKGRKGEREKGATLLSPSPPLPLSPFACGGETVLLAEDQPDLRSLVHMILEQKGYRVLEAMSGGDAVLLCHQHAGAIDLLVTDVIMPNMSGPQLAERLRAEQPKLKVLFLSGYTDDAIVRHGVLSPGTPFLQKPFNPNTLLTKVREVLDGVT